MSDKHLIAHKQSQSIVKKELVATYGFKLVVSGLSASTLNVAQFPSIFSTLNTLEHSLDSVPAQVIVVSLVVVTAFLISNTIKLTIFSRRSEIEIMRLVGSSNTAIKLPFVFEGFMLGIVGSLVPIIITIFGYTILFDKVGTSSLFSIVDLIKPLPFSLYVSALLLLIGALVGMVGSARAVRKYLKI